jgi:transcriptional regulator with PAS, ATPase and Fis domain
LLHRTWNEIAVASRAGDTLLICGESGAGKELAARHMHHVCFGEDSDAPFVAVNCATIPEGLAERLLFGARRGAYSGATADARGYIAAAHQGTLFLDEIAELDPRVQAKLLRVLEAREVMPLGESRPQRVQVRICAASHRNLRDEVSAGRFREDLYFRIGRPEIVLPPLRQRLDEVPWLIAREAQLAAAKCRASPGFIEACALRHWSGNVRELLREVRLAAHAALDAGSCSIEARHLSPEAGQLLTTTSTRTPAQTSAPHPDLDRERIERALAAHDGNVSRAARALGLHRNQLRRWLAKRASSDPREDDTQILDDA